LKLLVDEGSREIIEIKVGKGREGRPIKKMRNFYESENKNKK